ncbi:RNA polymerase sigma-70 factor [Larkinella knui]|uniref:RNA polymerase sigma-70 factor n=2 Tax=Larkinella knui TaxID=2025310 RepID=A0A3P1CYI5_9BACT|nr:RNA polymerase sigma-70 factor [Larkinella knui]
MPDPNGNAGNPFSFGDYPPGDRPIGERPLGDPPPAHFQRSSAVLDAELLIHKAFEQNPDAGIALLFQHYYQPLCSHVVRFVSSKEIAEDIVSDIFYEFHVGRIYRTITTSYRAFLFTAVRNRAFDYVRAEMKRSTSLDQAERLSFPVEQQPDSVTQFEELYHDVEKAIDAMPMKQRQVYVMHRFEGRKYAEIAAELNLSLRTVEVHMYRAIHHVRAFLKDKWLILLISFYPYTQ